jgi:hypothetical protein
MEAGDVVGDRFVLERFVGSGGMGSIWRAIDRSTGALCAIKFMSPEVESESARFSRESAVLAQLLHPAIVRHVAHGVAPNGAPLLAMEWLEGEDLAQRTRRQGLTLGESLTMARRVADALAYAHERGVIHRDIKPNNLFLIDGDPARVIVLDFGIARLVSNQTALTGTNAMLGTLGYMAPEQATGARNVDGRADLFALGCVLYECLVGRPAFGGENAMAVLANVLIEEPPRVRSIRPEIPVELDELVSRMLAKNRDLRPRNAREVAEKLDEILGTAEADAAALAPASVVAQRLTGGEKRLMCVILAEHQHLGELELDATLAKDALIGEHTEIAELAKRWGGAQVQLMAGGAATIIAIGRSGSATDRVVHAARCALEIASLQLATRIALATGPAEVGGGTMPIGPVISRAAALLSLPGEQKGVRIDATTAALLDPRFDVVKTPQFSLLASEIQRDDTSRQVFGKPMPFEGRERELVLLDSALAEAQDESSTVFVLVTGPASVGKSRLGLEFANRIAARGGVQALWARAEPQTSSTPYGLVIRLASHAAGVHLQDDPAARRRALQAYFVEAMGEPLGTEFVECLAMLSGDPASTTASEKARAANGDPKRTAEWVHELLREWLSAAAAREPLLVVLDDLQWTDRASAVAIADVVRRIGERAPMLILALARPQVSDEVPELRVLVDTRHVQLGPLSRKGAERLARATVPPGTNDDVVSKIVERASGNPFYLEELIRHLGNPNGGEMPETVLLMAQSLLESLSSDERRILRAASVFGDVFWGEGVAALVKFDEPEALASGLASLARERIVEPSTRHPLPGQQAYAFRTPVLRIAAYSMLTGKDRATGHRLAGEWLECVGETDGAVIAEHFFRSDLEQRAADLWLREADAARSRGDVARAEALETRARDAYPRGNEPSVSLVSTAKTRL